MTKDEIFIRILPLAYREKQRLTHGEEIIIAETNTFPGSYLDTVVVEKKYKVRGLDFECFVSSKARNESGNFEITLVRCDSPE